MAGSENKEKRVAENMQHRTMKRKIVGGGVEIRIHSSFFMKDKLKCT